MKTKKIIPIALIAIALITTATIIIFNQKPEPEPTILDDGSLAPIQVGDYIATDYPRDMPREAVSGMLGSLNTYVNNILDPESTVATFLDYSYQNQILRLNITDETAGAVLVTKDNKDDFEGEKNPLRSTKQLVMYAAKSGHTINNLFISDEISTAGVKDFASYLDGESPYILTDASRAEIIKCLLNKSETRTRIARTE